MHSVRRACGARCCTIDLRCCLSPPPRAWPASRCRRRLIAGGLRRPRPDACLVARLLDRLHPRLHPHDRVRRLCCWSTSAASNQRCGACLGGEPRDRPVLTRRRATWRPPSSLRSATPRASPMWFEWKWNVDGRKCIGNCKRKCECANANTDVDVNVNVNAQMQMQCNTQATRSATSRASPPT